MSPQPERYVSVRLQCRCGEEHRFCWRTQHQGIPAPLRCPAPAGTGHGGSRCPLPTNFDERLIHVMRSSVEKWIDLGYVIFDDR